MLAHLGIERKHCVIHERSMISSIMVQSRRRLTGGVVTEEPHGRSVGIELGLDVRGEVVASIDDHPNVRGVQPASYDEASEATILEHR